LNNYGKVLKTELRRVLAKPAGEEAGKRSPSERGVRAGVLRSGTRWRL